MSNCPKCSRRIESFAVDTNCSFRMCSNVSCTWPFDCADMGQYFEYDAAVPSIRKRAKKRKAHKDEGRKLKKAKTLAATAETAAATSTATKATPEAAASAFVEATGQLSSSVAAARVSNVAENAAQISSWLSDLCDSNIRSRATLLDSSQRSSLVDNLDFPVAGNYQNNMGSESLGEATLSNCNNPNIDLDDSWINTLLGSSSKSDASVPKHNGLNSADPLSDGAVAASDTVDDVSCLLNHNVADIFAVLGHGVTPAVPSRDGSIGSSGDAGVPRNSRQNSPAASNSESGADDIDNPILSADDLAMIIGGTSKPHATMQQQQQQASATTAATAPLDTSALLDPISMLLSPPNSAAAGSVAHPGSALDLFSQYYWPPQQQQQQHSDKLSMLTSSSLATPSVSATVSAANASSNTGVISGSSSVGTKPPASDHLSFDLHKLFNVPVAATGNSQASASEMVASLGSSTDLIENIFGKSSL